MESAVEDTEITSKERRGHGLESVWACMGEVMKKTACGSHGLAADCRRGLVEARAAGGGLCHVDCAKVC
ncbi:HIG1 domain-containing protein [Psidium guajava]|nr:HIG1 domain-containing protein [Psidium guajava]